MIATSPALIRLRVASPLLVVCALIVIIARLIPSDTPSAQAQPIFATLAPIIITATPALPLLDQAQNSAVSDQLAPTATAVPLEPTPEPVITFPTEPAQEVPAVGYEPPAAPNPIFVETPPTPDPFATAPIDPVLNDPAQNGGNVADPGCPFPVLNGVCANGRLANDESQDGSKIDMRSREEHPAPGHGDVPTGGTK